MAFLGALALYRRVLEEPQRREGREDTGCNRGCGVRE